MGHSESKLQCPSCGLILNESEGDVCSRCQVKLAPAQDTAPDANIAPPEVHDQEEYFEQIRAKQSRLEARICLSCGGDRGGASFECPHCGAMAEQDSLFGGVLEMRIAQQLKEGQAVETIAKDLMSKGLSEAEALDLIDQAGALSTVADVQLGSEKEQIHRKFVRSMAIGIPIFLFGAGFSIIGLLFGGFGLPSFLIACFGLANITCGFGYLYREKQAQKKEEQ